MMEAQHTAYALREHMGADSINYMVLAYPYTYKAKLKNAALLCAYLKALNQPHNSGIKAIVLDIIRKNLPLGPPSQLKELYEEINKKHNYWEVSVNSPNMLIAESLAASLGKMRLSSLCSLLSVAAVKYVISNNATSTKSYFPNACLVCPPVAIVCVKQGEKQYYTLMEDGQANMKNSEDKIISMFIPHAEANEKYFVISDDKQENKKQLPELNSIMDQQEEIKKDIEASRQSYDKAINNVTNSYKHYKTIENIIGITPLTDAKICELCRKVHIDMKYIIKLDERNLYCKNCLLIKLKEDPVKYRSQLLMYNMLRKDNEKPIEPTN